MTFLHHAYILLLVTKEMHDEMREEELGQGRASPDENYRIGILRFRKRKEWYRTRACAHFRSIGKGPRSPRAARHTQVLIRRIWKS